MRTLTFFTIYVLLLVFATSQVSSVTETAQVGCTAVKFPDMMDIQECLNGPLRLCGDNRPVLRETSRTLAKCLVRSMATRNFLGIVVRGLVQAGTYAMQASLPGSSLVAFPFFKRFRSFFRRPGTQHKIIFTSRPCNQTVEAYFPDVLRIGNCIRPEHFMCTKSGWMDLRTQLVTSLLSMIVCVMRKVPYFNVLFLLKDIMCAALQFFREWLQRWERFPISVPALEFFEVIFGCHSQFGMPSTAERKLFESVGFHHQ